MVMDSERIPFIQLSHELPLQVQELLVASSIALLSQCSLDRPFDFQWYWSNTHLLNVPALRLLFSKLMGFDDLCYCFVTSSFCPFSSLKAFCLACSVSLRHFFFSLIRYSADFAYPSPLTPSLILMVVNLRLLHLMRCSPHSNPLTGWSSLQLSPIRHMLPDWIVRILDCERPSSSLYSLLPPLTASCLPSWRPVHFHQLP